MEIKEFRSRLKEIQNDLADYVKNPNQVDAEAEKIYQHQRWLAGLVNDLKLAPWDPPEQKEASSIAAEALEDLQAIAPQEDAKSAQVALIEIVRGVCEMVIDPTKRVGDRVEGKDTDTQAGSQ